VDDASSRIDNAHPRAEAIERLGEARGIRLPEIDKSADEHRAADMRNDEAHAPARFIVDKTVGFAAKHPEQRHAGRRFIEHRRYGIHQALRARPLLIKPRFQELLVRDEIRYCDQLLDLGEVLDGRGGIEFYIFIEIELSIIRVSAKLIMDTAAPGGWALGIDCRRRAADEVPGLADHVAPQRGINRCVVDLADEFR
jgi:hypothetical protein